MDNKNVFVAIALSMSVLLFWGAFFETPRKQPSVQNQENVSKVENEITPSINQKIQKKSLSRQDALSESDRVLIKNKNVEGSISLKGGIFDDLSNQHPNVSFHGILETDRGCPFKCTFCDWGSLTHQKMKTFDLGRVYDEMTLLSKKEVESFHFTNSNLGIFKERDYKIIDYLCNLHKKTGYPKIVNEAGYSKTPQEKNSNLEIKKRLKKEFGDTYRPPRVSLQSLDENILTNIKKGLGTDEEAIEAVLSRRKSSVPDLYAEYNKYLAKKGETDSGDLIDWLEGDGETRSAQIVAKALEDEGMERYKPGEQRKLSKKKFN